MQLRNFTLNTNQKRFQEGKLKSEVKIYFFVWSNCFFSIRGISSTVRRCIEKETGKEYAAKIIDLSNDNAENGCAAEATRQEVAILRLVAGHPYISK